jgi:hypothetical protein
MGDVNKQERQASNYATLSTWLNAKPATSTSTLDPWSFVR